MGGVKTRKSSPEISLLYCSPIYDVIEVAEDIEVKAGRARSFNADLHSKHFRHVFEQVLVLSAIAHLIQLSK